MRTYALVLFLMGIVAFSCQKDDNEDPDNKTRTQLITSATWKYDTVMLDTNNDGKADAPVPDGYLEDCTLDNTITLNADSTGVLNEGTLKCDPADPQTTPITWMFKDNETVLSSPSPIFGGLSGDAKITLLTDTKLQLQKETTVSGLGLTVNIILDLKH